MRTELEAVVAKLRARGDQHISYVSGLELFSEADMASGLMPDALHPNGEGYLRMAARFTRIAFGHGGKLLPGRVLEASI